VLLSTLLCDQRYRRVRQQMIVPNRVASYYIIIINLVSPFDETMHVCLINNNAFTESNCSRTKSLYTKETDKRCVRYTPSQNPYDLSSKINGLQMKVFLKYFIACLDNLSRHARRFYAGVVNNRMKTQRIRDLR